MIAAVNIWGMGAYFSVENHVSKNGNLLVAYYSMK